MKLFGSAAVFMFIVMLCIVIAACGGKDGLTPAVGDTAASSADAEIESPSPYGDSLPDDLDYGGYEFTVLTFKGGNTAEWPQYIDIDTQNGDLLNDAAFNRNVTVEDRLNIQIKVMESNNTNDCSVMFGKIVLSGDNSFDIGTFFGPENISSLVLENMVYNWLNMPYVDLEADYYARQANTEYNILGKQLFAVSDITYCTQAFSLFLFNKNLLEDYGLETPYRHVYDGTWTYGKMLGYIKGTYSDLNGNAKKDYGDIFGFSDHPYMPSYFYFGFGGVATVRDGSGRITPVLFDEKVVSIVETLVGFVTDDHVFLNESKGVQNFMDGNALFVYYGSNKEVLRDIEAFDFGLLIEPKYDEMQNEYIVPAYGGLTGIPVTANDMERTGSIVEALASSSHRFLRDAFAEVYVQQKILRDEDSQKIYKLCSEHTMFDILKNCDPSGSLSSCAYINTMLNSKNADVASAAAKIESKVTAAFEHFHDRISR